MLSAIRLAWVCGLCVASLASCAPAPEYLTATPDQIETIVAKHGTKEFPVDVPTAVNAAVAGLRASGFEVAMTNESKGLVKTGRKMLVVHSQTQQAYGGAQGSSVPESFQLVARVTPRTAHASVIRLEPHWFYGDLEVTPTQGRISQLPRALYDALEQIDDAMPREPPPTASSTEL